MVLYTIQIKMVKRIQNVRMEETQIEFIKKIAKKEGKTFSDIIRERVYCDPIIEEKLNLILEKIENGTK